MLEKLFKLKESNTNIQTELLAGFTTFITMAYIIFVNPQMMSYTGMDLGASFVGTCLAAAIACFAMGFMAGQEARKREMNTPICVTVGRLYDVEILKCFDMIFFL